MRRRLSYARLASVSANDASGEPLVPADGFFEWHKEGKEKTPTYIYLKSREPFAFAGLWDSWGMGCPYVRLPCIIASLGRFGLV